MTFRSCYLFAGLLLLSLSCQSNTNAHTEPNKQPVTKPVTALEPTKIEAAVSSPVEPEPSPEVKPAAPTPTPKPTVDKLIEPKPVKTKAQNPTIQAPKEAPIVVNPVIEKPIQVQQEEVVQVIEAPEVTQPVAEIIKEPVVATVDHSAWDALLQKYVTTTGTVDYKGFKASEAKLDSYLQQLSATKPAAGAARAEAMSYWLNAYNAYTIKLILKNYPVASIQDIGGGKPWDLKWIKLGGELFSLNQIENEIIRPTFKDPRIHFAVNCAAKSCPPLYNKAFIPARLEQQLEQLTKAFVNNTAYNQLSGSPRVSKIFEWYSVDFGDVAAYISKYANAPIAGPLAYADYDWALNGK